MNFEDEMDQRLVEIEAILRDCLPKEEGFQKTVIEAMNYSVLGGGKRLRPMLMLESYRVFGGTEKVIEPFMAAIEMIHTYSLVHDDLPAMDNDDYRRGRKTTHVVYGEAMAILAGDSLLNYAFEIALEAVKLADKTELKVILQALSILAKKAGIQGMIGGQTADILAEGKGEDVTRELLRFIHKNKTAALMEASMMIGAELAGADLETIEKVEQIAEKIGLAFQIQDDILDITSSPEVLGKPVGSDAKNEKLTYATLLGLDASREQVAQLTQEALQIIKGFSIEDEFLTQLLVQLITREK